MIFIAELTVFFVLFAQDRILLLLPKAMAVMQCSGVFIKALPSLPEKKYQGR